MSIESAPRQAAPESESGREYEPKLDRLGDVVAEVSRQQAGFEEYGDVADHHADSYTMASQAHERVLEIAIPAKLQTALDAKLRRVQRSLDQLGEISPEGYELKINALGDVVTEIARQQEDFELYDDLPYGDSRAGLYVKCRQEVEKVLSVAIPEELQQELVAGLEETQKYLDQLDENQKSAA